LKKLIATLKKYSDRIPKIEIQDSDGCLSTIFLEIQSRSKSHGQTPAQSKARELFGLVSKHGHIHIGTLITMIDLLRTEQQTIAYIEAIYGVIPPKLRIDELQKKMIRIYGEYGNLHQALDLYEHTPKDAFTHNAMLKAFIDCNKYDAARNLFNTIPEEERNPGTYSIWIRALFFINLREAEHIFETMPFDKKDIRVKDLMLNKYLHEYKFDKAERIIETITPDQIELSTKKLMLLIYGEKGDLEKVTTLYKSIPSQDRSNCEILTMIKFFNRWGTLETVLTWHRAIATRDLDSATDNIRLKVMIDKRDFKGATNFFGRIPEKNKDTFMMNSILMLHQEMQRFTEAETLFTTMRQRPDIITKNVMINVYIHLNKMQEAKNLYHSIPSKQRTIVTHNTLLGALVASGDLKAAEELHSRIPRQNRNEVTEILWKKIQNLSSQKTIQDTYIETVDNRAFAATNRPDIVTKSISSTGDDEAYHDTDLIPLEHIEELQGMGPMLTITPSLIEVHMVAPILSPFESEGGHPDLIVIIPMRVPGQGLDYTPTEALQMWKASIPDRTNCHVILGINARRTVGIDGEIIDIIQYECEKILKENSNLSATLVFFTWHSDTVPYGEFRNTLMSTALEKVGPSNSGTQAILSLDGDVAISPKLVNDALQVSQENQSSPLTYQSFGYQLEMDNPIEQLANRLDYEIRTSVTYKVNNPERRVPVCYLAEPSLVFSGSSLNLLSAHKFGSYGSDGGELRESLEKSKIYPAPYLKMAYNELPRIKNAARFANSCNSSAWTFIFSRPESHASITNISHRITSCFSVKTDQICSVAKWVSPQFLINNGLSLDTVEEYLNNLHENIKSKHYGKKFDVTAYFYKQSDTEKPINFWHYMRKIFDDIDKKNVKCSINALVQWGLTIVNFLKVLSAEDLVLFQGDFPEISERIELNQFAHSPNVQAWKTDGKPSRVYAVRSADDRERRRAQLGNITPTYVMSPLGEEGIPLEIELTLGNKVEPSPTTVIDYTASAFSEEAQSTEMELALPHSQLIIEKSIASAHHDLEHTNLDSPTLSDFTVIGNKRKSRDRSSWLSFNTTDQQESQASSTSDPYITVLQKIAERDTQIQNLIERYAMILKYKNEEGNKYQKLAETFREIFPGTLDLTRENLNFFLSEWILANPLPKTRSKAQKTEQTRPKPNQELNDLSEEWEG